MKRLTIKALLFLAAAAGLALAAGVEEWPGVKNYGDSVNIVLSPDEEAGFSALTRAARGHQGYPLHLDPRLALVARELAREIQSDLSRQPEIMSSDRALKLMNLYGLYETSTRVRSFTYLTNGDIQSQVRLYFDADRSDYTHAGIGTAPPDRRGRPGVAVVIISERRADLSPFPRRAPMPSSWTLRGRLVNTSRGLTPSIALTDPRGRLHLVPINRDGDFFSASITFDGEPGVYRIEVMASGGGKAQVSALMAVTAGGPAAVAATWEVLGFPELLLSEDEAEASMIEMINQVRVKEGLEPLRVDPRLSRMAKDHSRDMKDNRFAGHLSPGKGGVPERARAHGLGNYQVKENIALAPGLVQAMNNLLQSPVHRATLLDPEMTHLGVGIAFDDSQGTRNYYITQEFATAIPQP